MMDVYVRKSDLLKKAIRVSEFDEGGWERVLRAVPVEDIEAAEAVDASPVVHGRWVQDGGFNTYCSHCEEYIPTVHCHQDYQDDEYDWDEEIEKTEYCPHCGAKMDKEE